jgi:rubrerythrin
MKPASSASNALASALAQRQRAAARWRALALDAGSADDALAAALTRVSASEQQHAERLARELPMIDGEELLRVIAGGSGSRAEAAPEEPGSGATRAGGAGRPAARIARALEDALRQERRLRAAFEQLAARSPDDEVRVRALALALAETRHLRALEEAVASLRCKL